MHSNEEKSGWRMKIFSGMIRGGSVGERGRVCNRALHKLIKYEYLMMVLASGNELTGVQKPPRCMQSRL